MCSSSLIIYKFDLKLDYTTLSCPVWGYECGKKSLSWSIITKNAASTTKFKKTLPHPGDGGG
jgi:hypothetical protein